MRSADRITKALQAAGKRLPGLRDRVGYPCRVEWHLHEKGLRIEAIKLFLDESIPNLTITFIVPGQEIAQARSLDRVLRQAERNMVHSMDAAVAKAKPLREIQP